MQLPTLYQQFIHKSRYARWLDSDLRRESWEETVDRYVNFMLSHMERENGFVPEPEEVAEVRQYILEQKAMPSMRAVMTAGPALERDNIAGYNCSYVPVDHPRAFDETLYILMNGTGVGFSVESKYVSQLPAVPQGLDEIPLTIKVEDSKFGWADSYRRLLEYLWDGFIPAWDTSEVRAAGARLKTFGGRASGPEPLEELFRFTVETFVRARGRQLTDLECHDLMCKIAEIVVVGGVRRSALISLSDLSSNAMASAKVGEWYYTQPHRTLANNSVAYDSKPTYDKFLAEWKILERSGSGERGIFNREASKKQAARSGRRDSSYEFGTNPCSEIILRKNQFCNLSEVIVREQDTIEDLANKVRIATILGTWQSTLTNFQYLRPIWKENTEAERLLGVSLTGQMGHAILNGSEGLQNTAAVLESLKSVAVATNSIWADRIGIQRSTAITCVKPSGTVSQLTNSASGMHAWHAPYYIRTVRGDIKDPLTQFMIDSGIPAEPDVMRPESTMVFSFPVAAPKSAVTRKDLTAIEQLEIWLTYQSAWCEHKPSVTISVKPDEWDAVGEWVWKNFDAISGISFLPFDDHVYQQAPYQDCTEEEYLELASKMPSSIRWEDLSFYEFDDNTSGTQTLACSASGCETVDVQAAPALGSVQ